MVAGSHYREGKPEEDVARLAEEIEVGLIVVGGRKVGRFASLFATSFSEAVYGRALRGAGGVRMKSVGRGAGEANRADDGRHGDRGPTAAFEHPGISCFMHRDAPVMVAAFGTVAKLGCLQPTRMTCTSPGPCIPTNNDISMSPDRLGPVWKHTLAGNPPVSPAAYFSMASGTVSKILLTGTTAT